jgi:hypothetical protein
MTLGFDRYELEALLADSWKQTASLAVVVPAADPHDAVVGSKATVPSTLVLDDGVAVIPLPVLHDAAVMFCFTPVAQAPDGTVTPAPGVLSPANTTLFADEESK